MPKTAFLRPFSGSIVLVELPSFYLMPQMIDFPILLLLRASFLSAPAVLAVLLGLAILANSHIKRVKTVVASLSTDTYFPLKRSNSLGYPGRYHRWITQLW